LHKKKSIQTYDPEVFELIHYLGILKEKIGGGGGELACLANHFINNITIIYLLPNILYFFYD